MGPKSQPNETERVTARKLFPHQTALTSGDDIHPKGRQTASRQTANHHPTGTPTDDTGGTADSPRTDWKHPAIPREIVTTMVVKGLIERDAAGALTLTDREGGSLRMVARAG